jgi:uncharacterized circularly permuted ATP-grasp superfamily protein/uncharacterized alpha-E superfamily protein
MPAYDDFMLVDPSTTRLVRWPYAGVAGYFDEMLEAPGKSRPHYRQLLDLIANLGSDEFDRRWKLGQQIVHENGVTYTIYGDDPRQDRQYQLDPIPMVISSTEWKTIEAAAVQRTRLVNSILADLYGKQSLLCSGAIPPAAIFAQSAFVRPMIGVGVPHNIYCHIHAIDLARAPSGQWWVVGDRTQSPSGMGYAIEHRLVSTRTLPDVFGPCQVTRLAAFFGELNQMILSLAPRYRDNPRVVLLTPGAYNETYFEHAYLARYLGYTLAEGRDLTVREGKVYLKTLSGLLPVDVILRRTDDLYCDPLELRDDSVLGIAGLMQAVRGGQVAIANPIGTGIAQAPALLPFFSGLCKSLLGQDLLLPSIATWWCGQEKPMHEVLSKLDKLVIKPALPGSGVAPIFGSSLSKTQLDQLANQIRSAPSEWVAQEQVELSTSPCWEGSAAGGKLSPRHTMLRVFVAAKTDGTYTVMPGGLCRISPAAGSMVVTMQRGGGSKDAWVLSDGPVNLSNPLRPPHAPVEITRAGQVLPSRVADEMFWLGRYVDRAEYGVRVGRALCRRTSTDPASAQSLLMLLSGRSSTAASSSSTVLSCSSTQTTEPTLDDERLIECLFDPAAASRGLRSVRGDIDSVYRVASNLRDRLPGDAWRAISTLSESFTRPRAARGLILSQTADLLDRAMTLLAAFTGQTADSMLRDKGWAFLEVGRRIERSLHLVELVRWAFGGKTCTHEQLDEILEITSSTRTYRSRYLTTLQNAPVLDLLLLDESNPQSLAFQLLRASELVASFSPDTTSSKPGEDRRILIDLVASIRLLDVEKIFNAQPDTIDPQHLLFDLLAKLNVELPRLSDVIAQTYLAHVRVSPAKGDAP